MNWEAFGEVENNIVGVILVSPSQCIFKGCRISAQKNGKFQLFIVILFPVLEDSRL
jgi:hypothetical protein